MPIPSYKNFDKSKYAWSKDIDYRKEPEKYIIGKGEQGVLICEPYKSEICQHWRFKTPEIATESSTIIYNLFLKYLNDDDFVGADLARKYLQMGFTRSRRYANYKGGLKYDQKDGSNLEKGTGDPAKIMSAQIFYEKWQEAEQHPKYAKLKKEWKEKYG